MPDLLRFSVAFTRYGLRSLRIVAAVIVALSLSFSSIAPAFAAGGQTGTITGVVTNVVTSAPVANATVVAVSPTGRFETKSRANGTFTLLGVTVDTYTLTVTSNGYQLTNVSGVTVSGDQSVAVTVAMTTTLQTIGRVTARARNGAFQPTQTQDSFTISGARITQALGKANSTDENSLALSAPGVQLTSSGALTIRGGLSTEVGYQFDGVDFTEPFLYGNASNGSFNGLSSLQVVAGAGDASQGNVGGGVINVVPKRGARPAFGSFDLESGGPAFNHQFSTDYGFATPNGRFSNYTSIVGQRFAAYNGSANQNAAQFSNTFGISNGANDDVLNNAIYKFAKDNHESIQLLYNVRNLQLYGNYGGIAGNLLYSSDPSSYGANFGAGVSSTDNSADPGNPFGDPANYGFFKSHIGTLPYSGSVKQTTPELVSYNPTRFLKFEYDNNLNASTYLSLKAYNWQTLQGGTNYYSGSPAPTSQITGGSRTGLILDIVKTLSEKHTITIGGKLENSHPLWDGIFAYQGYNQLLLNGGGTPQIQDFATPANVNAPISAANPCPIVGGCYLYNTGNFSGGTPAVPQFGINYNKTDLQTFGLYIRDQFTPNAKLKIDIGLRLDGENWKQGANPYSPDLSNPTDVNVVPQPGNPNFLRDEVVKPRITEPRFGAAYQFGPADSLRFTYGRSVVFANSQTLGTPGAMYGIDPRLNSVAPIGNTADPTTWTCGSGLNTKYAATGNFFRCTSYAQQLYWSYDQNNDAPDVGNNIPPTQNNFDLGYQHQFRSGWGARLTGYFKRGYNVPAFAIVSQQFNPITGSPTQTIFSVNNVGVNKTSGIEAGLTTPDKAVGFSGFLSATYTNAITSTPPLVGGENALPTISKASLVLGDTYRAGFISPFVVRVGGTYRTKSGFHINPVIGYDRGFPIGVGNIVATQVGTSYFNLPQTNLVNTKYSGYQGITGAANATNYVDPSNPGSRFRPNIAATRGTSEAASAGGILSRPRIESNLAIEYVHTRNTFGVLAENLFGNVYGEPIVNPFYQPVATGVAGPQTGVGGPAAFGQPGYANLPGTAHAFEPYIQIPNRPLVLRFYYQLAL